MAKPLRLLVIDDSEDDVLLLIRALHKGGITFESAHVETAEELRSTLSTSQWDIVISDHSMLGFTSSEVLKIVSELDDTLPVIIVSGAIGEELGVGAMHHGAQDYIMKDNLAKLIPVIKRQAQQNEDRKARQVAEENLRYLAYHDRLTDLVNRQEFERRINLAVADTKHGSQSHVLMFLDLDQFKLINDTCGHVAGDELLVIVTQALKLPIRETDTLARLGGDEFGILLKNCSQEEALQTSERIIREIQNIRFAWQEKRFDISVCIGMVQINEDAKSSEEILSRADIACCAAKEKGRSSITWYNADDQEYHRRRSEMQWVPKINQAIEENRFCLYQQPMACLKGDPGNHSEFLLRLFDNGQMIAPGNFIPAAERYNLMSSIDRWVVNCALNYLKESGLGRLDEGTYFINLSGNTLSDQAFFDFIKETQSRYEVKPERICFEITETAAIANLMDAVDFIEEIRELGFKFALDDFGVGLSSFSYLKTIPVDYLKIDGSFVLNMLNDEMDRGIVEACNQIGHAAGLKTIAEFVENSAIQDALRNMGVDYAQGFGIAKPGPLPLLTSTH